MRIRVTTSSPLATLKSWFPIDPEKIVTIRDVRKQLNDHFKLAPDSDSLKLEMQDFDLPGGFRVSDIIYEGDIITVKAVDDLGQQTRNHDSNVTQDTHTKKSAKKKKEKTRDKSKKVEKKKKESKVVKKVKEKLAKSKTKKKDEESKKKTKAGGENKAKTAVAPSHNRRKAEEAIEEQQTAPNTKRQKTQAEEKATLPGQGTKRTKSRNMRRRKLRLSKQSEQTEPEPAVVTNTVEPLAAEPPEEMTSQREEPQPHHLVKQNKNKKKNFLKEMQKAAPLHVRFDAAQHSEIAKGTSNSVPEHRDQEEAFEEQLEAHHQTSMSAVCGAVISVVESHPNYPPNPKPSPYLAKLPIHNTPEYFTVPAVDHTNDQKDDQLDEQSSDTSSDSSDDSDTSSSDASSSSDEASDHEAANDAVVVREPGFYDNLPKLDFTGKLPTVGDRVAIKILELSPSYTPQISDWKEVQVLEVNTSNQTIYVEYQPGFFLMENRGGKFELTEKNGDDEEEEYYDEDVPLEDQKVLYSWGDIVNICKL